MLQFPNGSANLTYRSVSAPPPLVLRRPPFGTDRAGRARHAARVQGPLPAVTPRYPRAPRALLFCDDHSVDRGRLPGDRSTGPGSWSGTAIPDVDGRPCPTPAGGIGLAVIDALADLHRVDPASCGLGDLGRPDGFLARQVARLAQAVGRWSRRRHGDRSRTRSASGWPPPCRISGRPSCCTTTSRSTTVSSHRATPTTVMSVFDWDMATLGDPLADLGTLLNYWPDPAARRDGVPGLAHSACPPATRWSSATPPRSGRHRPCRRRLVRGLRLLQDAVILQQLYARHLRGETTDERMGERGAQVDPLAERALDLLRPVP